MYAVSDNYMTAMHAWCRDMTTARVHILNIDVDRQLQIGVSATNQQGGTALDDILHVSGRTPAELAAESTHYVSSYASSSAAEGSGYRIYPYPVITLTGLSGIDTVTLHVPPDATPSAITAVGTLTTGSGTTSKDYIPADGDELIRLDCKGCSKLVITIYYMHRPSVYCHVLRVYAGAGTTYDGADDLLDIGIDEINDCVCLELPQKTLTVSIANRGQYTAEQEYDSPSWHQYSTQAIAYFGATLQDGSTEWVPLGRYFLDSYEVTDGAVNFRLAGPLTVLNSVIHYWSGAGNEITNTTLIPQMEAVMQTVVGTTDVPEGQYKRSGALRYDIRAQIAGYADSRRQLYAACPPVPAAQALQLYALLSGRTIRELRGQRDIAVRELAMDTITQYIPGDEYYSWPKWAPDAKVGTINMQVYRREPVDGEKTIADRLTISTSGCTPVPHTDNLIISNQSISCKSEADGTSTYNVYHYPYITYFRAPSVMVDGKVTGGGYTLATSTVSVKVADTGDTITIDNPLVTGRDDYTPQDVARGIYRIVRNNMVGTIEHRGYPEIDCGDVLAIDSADDRKYVLAVAIENHWRMTGGALKGSTVVRRLDMDTWPRYDGVEHLSGGIYYVDTVQDFAPTYQSQIRVGTLIVTRFADNVEYQPSAGGCNCDVGYTGMAPLRWDGYDDVYSEPMPPGLYLLRWTSTGEWYIDMEIKGGLSI